MKTKKLLTTAALFILVVGAVLAIPQAHAQETNTKSTNFFQGLIESIAQKFGLDKNQVQGVVNDYQQQHKQTVQKNMQDKQKARLDQLVKDGKITSAQEDVIIKELESLKTKYDPATMKDKTPAERKAQFDAMQNELKTWAQSQGIDPTYVMPGFGMGRRMMKGGMRRGNWPKTSVTPTPTP